MCGQDAGVNDVGTDACTSAVVVDVGGEDAGLVGDTAKTPGRAALADVGVDRDNGILLDKLNLYDGVSTGAKSRRV